MPRQDDDIENSNQPSQADDVAAQKALLWKLAKEAAEVKRTLAPSAPPPRQEPPPPPKRRIKLKAPPIAKAAAPVPVELAEPHPIEISLDDEEPLPPEPEVLDEPEIIEVKEELPPAPPPEKPVAKKPERKKSKKSEEPEKSDPADIGGKDSADAKDKDKEPADTEPKPAPEGDGPLLTHKQQLAQFWERIGGRSLSLSLALHAIVIIAGFFIYITYTKEERVDFMPGGGTLKGEEANKALENKIERKRNPWLNRKPPMQRIAVQNALSSITLPDEQPIMDLPMNREFLSPGKMMAGGGFGAGQGLGARAGITFKPITLFGKEIIGKRMAVVLDVSRSMTPHLEGVIKEVDRVAHGSPVLLYYGCGMLPAPQGEKPPSEATMRTQQREFERFWRIWQGDSSIGFNPTVDLKTVKLPGGPLPQEDVFRFLSRRNNTYFMDYNGMDFTWTALLNDLVRNADALYWFSDFEDNVDDKQLKIVLDNLALRKQRLYIHPQEHGNSFDKIRDLLAVPSGGDIIEPKDGDNAPKKKK